MQLLKAPVFQNVGAGLTAILPAFDRGMSYMGILLECGGTTFDNTKINEIEIDANGKTILKTTGAHMLSINKYYNETSGANYLWIPFADEEARTIDGQLMGAIDTSVLDSLSMRVEIDATAVAPTLNATVVAAPPKVMANGKDRPDRYVFRTWLDANHAPASGSEHQLQIPLGTRGGNLVKAVHFFHSNITEVKVKRDGVDQQNKGNVAAVDFFQNRRKRTTQAGHEVFDPTVFNNQSEALPTLRPDGTLAPWRFDVTTSAADTITSYTEAYVKLTSI